MSLDKLRSIVSEIGSEAIYRPILDRDGSVLMPGVEPYEEGLVAEFSSIPFQGRSVTDLGCNVGFFCFLAARLGASKVVGLDSDDRIVAACEVLRARHGLANVEFRAADLDAPADEGPCDIALLMDLIGRECVRKGRVDARLDWLRRRAPRQEAAISLRPVYKVKDRLGLSEVEVDRMYPGGYVSDGVFRLLDYIRDTLADDWVLSSQTRDDDRYGGNRVLVRFRARTS